MSECKSNANSLDIYSIRFSNCKTIYPIQVVRPIGKFKLDTKHYLENFLTDVCSNDCHIDALVADSLKRSDARECKGHSAYFPCEYCESKGILLNTQDTTLKNKKKELHERKRIINEQIMIAEESNDQNQVQVLKTVLKSVEESIKNLNKKNNNIVWPASTQNGPLRTIEKVLEAVDRLENNDILSNDEAKGIIGRSLFLDIPYFNFVKDIVVEYLHGVCLGVVKRMLILTFDVGEIKQRNTTRKLSSTTLFNKKMAEIKFTRESSRRARNLDLSVFKGQEYRNIIILYFPLVIDCIKKPAKERRLWLLLAYMVRLCVLPNEEYENVDINVLPYCSKNFYELYERLFHARNCTYYTHMIGCHMPQMRAHGPFTLTSAFGFESFYGELRHSFTPGTRSPLKQVMQKIMLKRSLANHCCESSIFYSTKQSGLESNNFVYTFVDKQYQFYKIKSIANNIFECCKVGKYPTTFPEAPTLQWEKIGVFEAGGISEEVVNINKENIAGKIIKVNNLFITCPNNVLLEK